MFMSDLKDMLEGIRSKLYFKTFKRVTDWDENFLKIAQLTVATCIDKVNDTFKNDSDSSSLLEAYLSVTYSISELYNDVHGSCPDVFMNVTCDGKLLAFHRFKMMNYFHSHTFDARGQNCGKIKSFIVKVVKISLFLS
jgi:hypothetical protein